MFIMGVFKLPFSLCDDLTRLIRGFGGVLRREEGRCIG
jgi:hypothetical protein